MAKEYSDAVLKNNKDSINAFFSFLDFSLNGLSILDLGCGDGSDLLRIQSPGASISGVDSSEEMVELAKKKNPMGNIRLGFFDKIPFPDQSFDWVVSKWAFQTAEEMDPVYKEIVRVLKPNGKLVFLTSHPIRQFVERKRKRKDYFRKEIVESAFFDGKITVYEPSHTLQEYLSPFFLQNFPLESFLEGIDAGAEKVDEDTYPSFIVIRAYLKA